MNVKERVSGPSFCCMAGLETTPTSAISRRGSSTTLMS
jgi:hypothetical protein